MEHLTPERLYLRCWALAVMDQSLDRLAEEYRARGQKALFDELLRCLADCNEENYDRIAARLGILPVTFRVKVKRCGDRASELLDATIADTLAAGEDVKEERRFLRGVLSN